MARRVTYAVYWLFFGLLFWNNNNNNNNNILFNYHTYVVFRLTLAILIPTSQYYLYNN